MCRYISVVCVSVLTRSVGKTSTSGWTIGRQDIDPVQDAVDIDGSVAVATQMQFFRSNSYDIHHDLNLTRN